jgi:hypothetical protein
MCKEKWQKPIDELYDASKYGKKPRIYHQKAHKDYLKKAQKNT